MFEINNGFQSIKQVKVSEIYPLIKKSSFQRNIDTNRVKNIKKYLLNQKEINGNFTFEGLITIGIYKNGYYCIDGQHRLSAYYDLIEQKSDIYILIDFRIVNSHQELRNLFKAINQGVQVPDYLLYEENEDAKNTIKNGIHNFKIEYQKYFVQSNSTRKVKRPNLRQNELENELFHSEFKFKNSDELTSYLKTINNKLCKLNNKQIYKVLDYFREIDYKDKEDIINNLIETVHKKNINNPLFIGLFKNFSYFKSKVDFETYLNTFNT
jgi:hypothetical protein